MLLHILPLLNTILPEDPEEQQRQTPPSKHRLPLPAAAASPSLASLPPRMPTIIIIPLILLNTLPTLKPPHAILPKLLNPRLKLRLHQTKIIQRPNPRDRFTRKAARAPVHEGAADGAKVVAHVVAGLDGLVLGEFCEFVFAAEVAEGGVVDDEVGGED